MAKSPFHPCLGLARCERHTVENRDKGHLGRYRHYIRPESVKANFLCLTCLENHQREKAGLIITENSKTERIVFLLQAIYELSTTEHQKIELLDNIQRE